MRARRRGCAFRSSRCRSPISIDVVMAMLARGRPRRPHPRRAERGRSRHPLRRGPERRAPTIRTAPAACTARCSRPTASSACSARPSSARSARSISSGAASISPSPASPAAPAPRHPGGIPNLPDDVTREAYSHEVSSAGFWPGGAGGEGGPFFYSYAYPTPEGFAEAQGRAGRGPLRRGARRVHPRL